MSRRALIAALVLGLGTSVKAQDEGQLQSFFEGRRVTVTIDMPGTSDGVDVQADSSQPLDYHQYGQRLKQYGTAIHSRQSATVTLVKIKGDHIEFQLNGGGYGTFGDDTSTSVSIPYVQPSARERELDRLIKEEDDPHKRERLEHERDDLRERRERQNRRIDADRAVAEAHKREVLQGRSPIQPSLPGFGAGWHQARGSDGGPGGVRRFLVSRLSPAGTVRVGQRPPWQ
jgi:hypothetical protein